MVRVKVSLEGNQHYFDDEDSRKMHTPALWEYGGDMYYYSSVAHDEEKCSLDKALEATSIWRRCGMVSCTQVREAYSQ